MGRLGYRRRIAASYLLSSPSRLTFRHETPELNPKFRADALGEYSMTFSEKADYPGPFDPDRVPRGGGVSRSAGGELEVGSKKGEVRRRRRFRVDFSRAGDTPGRRGASR